MIYEENRDRGFVILAVATDSGGEAAVRDFIRPPELEPAMFDFMSWSPELSARASAPTYPCLIDPDHHVAGLYGMVNVPTAVWIDEDGHAVRPPEPAGASDVFRAMDLETFTVPEDARTAARARKAFYVDAVREWIRDGADCRHVLPPDEVRRRWGGPTPKQSRARAAFLLGVWLVRNGHRERGDRWLAEAVRLHPGQWSYLRQRIILSDPALVGQFAATPEYWEAVQSLGDDYYYPPSDMVGMPPAWHPSKTGG